MNNTDVGFIIGVVPYREHDAMVQFLGHEYKMLRLVLPGFYKPTSKQSSLGQEFSKVRIRFNYRENSLLRIQNGELLDGFLNQRSDYQWLLNMSLAGEITQKLYDVVESSLWYTFWEEFIVSKRPNDVLLEFIVKLIKSSGFAPNVSACVVTGDTKIADFSIARGGFVSLPYKNAQHNYSLTFLQAIRYLFTQENIKQDVFEQHDVTDALLALLLEYIQFHMDVKFYSLKLIYDV